MSVIGNRPANRMDRHRLQSREQLRQAAMELLTEGGYTQLTIKAVTERADLGYGTFYLHFSDKDDIVWAVIYDIAEAQKDAIEASLEGVPSPYREYRSWVMLFEYVASVREGFLAMFGSQGSAKLLQRYQDYLAALHESNLRAGKYTVAIDLPPDFLAQYIAGALMRLMLWWAEKPNDYRPEDMARMIFQAAFRQPPPE